MAKKYFFKKKYGKKILFLKKSMAKKYGKKILFILVTLFS